MTHTYHLNFPAGLDADQVATWLTAVSGTLTTGPRRLVNVSSLAFEVEADERGIQYRLVVPEETADFLTGQLRALIPGSTAQPAGGEEPPRHWTAAVELGQTNPRRSLGTVNPATTAASLLAAMQGLGRGEALLLQWVVSPALRQRPPRAANELVLPGRRFTPRPDRDRINDVRAKLSEPNFLGVLRVAVKAPTKERGEHLLARIRASLHAVGTSDNRLKQRLTTSGRVVSRVESRAVPTLFPMQLAGSELVALICWPIGSPHVAGLPRSRTRQLAATGAVPRTGRVIARSNFPGGERPLALGVVESAQHLQVVGPTGSGKTALLANLITQDMNAGRGVILIESKGDLFQAALERVPERRLSDVVLLDVSDTEYPVGFNILTGSPYVVAADIQRLFDHLYPQDARGVRVRAGFYHLVLTLMMSTGASEKMTFADLQPLAVPRPDQEDFARRLIQGVSHLDELAVWWSEITSLGRPQRNAYFKPLIDRIWQLTSRRSLRNIIGQSQCTLNLTDIIRRRKILLVNLGRATEGKDTAGLLGSLLLNSIWSAVQAGAANPERPTMLYLDEFQDFLNLPISPADMFAQARSLGLAMTVAHQHLSQLSKELLDATQNNARSTVVFQTSADEAKDFARQFGPSVTEDDFMNLDRFEVVTRLATTGGVSSPMTGVTLPPVDPTGFGREARRLSRSTYGRPVAEVEAEIKQRRGGTPAPRASTRRRRFGGPSNSTSR
ncbi:MULTISPECIES: type IV secretory system conjugative DNA transfer family protein [Streptomyces]|uniref:TraM recognition domain-containing protein n=1 Tax=Streptomyces bobili TaxID=67280 RepID=A0ABZ1R820_9ACTN|nr:MULTISPECIES: TraM recognition domain-containing protein [Streptomyces]